MTPYERELLIAETLQRIRADLGIVLDRDSDRARIGRYIDSGMPLGARGGALPLPLIELVTTNETYFEREAHHFDIIMDELLPRLDRCGPTDRPIRILSAPCSSGEEPYSIALRLISRDSRLRHRPVEIVGVDVCPSVIERAVRAWYTPRSVHAVDPSMIARFFIPDGDGYTLAPIVAGKVRFEVGNLFDRELWDRIGDFDMIVSRNVMIYFDDQKNSELLTLFQQHIRDEGYVILGHADDHRRAREMFTPLLFGRSVVYQVRT